MSNKTKHPPDESERTTKEKAYEDDQQFDMFVDGDLDDDEFFEDLDKIIMACRLLIEAKVISSKSQFSAAIANMQELLVPMKEAAAICQVSRQSFRRLEQRGKIKIIRHKGSKTGGAHKGMCFINHTDIIKFLKARM